MFDILTYFYEKGAFLLPISRFSCPKWKIWKMFREPARFYPRHFDPYKGNIGLENTYFWSINILKSIR